MANRFWVGGTGTWDSSTTTHWATTSGGAGGASVPTSTDAVLFDANSGTGTVSVSGTVNAASIDFTGYTGTFSASSPWTLNVYGNLTFAAGMTLSASAAITIPVSGTSTIRSNGIVLSGITISGTATLADAMSITYSGTSVSISNLNAAGFGLTLTGSGTNPRATIGTGCTLSTVTHTLPTSGVSTLSISSTVPTMTINGGKKTNRLMLTSNLTVSGTLTLAGGSATDRLYVCNDVASAPTSAITISAGTVTASHVDFRGITAAGAANWNLSAITGGCGNAGGNTGITFTTATTRYWVGKTSSGSWSSTTMWATSSNGASGASVPLCHDSVVFDANSVTAGSLTITADMPRLGKDINFTGMLNSPTLSFASVGGSNFDTSIHGSLTLISGMSLSGSQSLTFEGDGTSTARTLTSAGRTFPNAITWDTRRPGTSSTVSLGDAFSCSSSLTLTNGFSDSGNFNVTAQSVTVTLNTGPMGNGNWTLTGTGTVWDSSASTSVVITPNSSTIIVNNASASSKTILGPSVTQTLANVQFTGSGTGAFNFGSSFTVNNLTMDTPPHTLTVQSGKTLTVNGTLSISGSSGSLNTLNASTPGSHHNIVNGGASVFAPAYLNIKDSWASPYGMFNAGSTDVDQGDNKNWWLLGDVIFFGPLF